MQSQRVSAGLIINRVGFLPSCLQLGLAFLEEATFSDHKKFKGKGFVKRADDIAQFF